MTLAPLFLIVFFQSTTLASFCSFRRAIKVKFYDCTITREHQVLIKACLSFIGLLSLSREARMTGPIFWSFIIDSICLEYLLNFVGFGFLLNSKPKLQPFVVFKNSAEQPLLLSCPLAFLILLTLHP